MKNQKAFGLRYSLALHNAILTIWSLAMFVEVAIDMYYLVKVSENLLVKRHHMEGCLLDIC